MITTTHVSVSQWRARAHDEWYVVRGGRARHVARVAADERGPVRSVREQRLTLL
jgi:hypothetical protein